MISELDILENSSKIKNTFFNEKTVLHNLKHYLPSQTPLKDFVHHNTLHAFQDMKFYDAIFKASDIFGFRATLQLTEFRELFKNGRIEKSILERVIVEKKGLANLEIWKGKLLEKQYEATNTARIGILRQVWKQKFHIALDSLVQPILFRIICCYLDQGISLWKFPNSNTGFFNAIKEIEESSFTSFFKSKRAKSLLCKQGLEITDLLKILVGDDERYYEQYLFDQQFTHKGWSGIVSSIENTPQSLLDLRKINLRDLILLELLLEIDAIDSEIGEDCEPLTSKVDFEPIDLFKDSEYKELNEVFALWQNGFEWSYYDKVLAGIKLDNERKISNRINSIANEKLKSVKNFQAILCIDERECSFRRHIERADSNSETFGTPGFFSVEFYFQPENGKFYEKLCPAPVTPKYLIKEINSSHKREHEMLYTDKVPNLILGTLYTFSLGFLSIIKLLLTIFRPKMSPSISDAFKHMDKDSELTIENKNISDIENNLQIGFTIEEMASRVESLLRSIGLIDNFSKLIYVIAHGSSSANNPHHSAHDCGACSGRPGSVNARVFAFMANHSKVRELLNSKGIKIPNDTQFVGSLHDTASDLIAYYDEHNLHDANIQLHSKNKIIFDNALDNNAKERSRRFASINTKFNLKKVRSSIEKRSVSMFEPRPELGHGTNSLCFIGNRALTKDLFLDRRAFLNSYNYRTDTDGSILCNVMKPIGPVCGGINLEYYFSRVDNYKLGAGTKLPHNVMGLIGVANSCDGDLRSGLPLQMIEVHDPVRLLVMVEHFPSVVLETIKSVPDMYSWYLNEWIHLIVIHPETNKFYYFKNEEFIEYSPITETIERTLDIVNIIESAKLMETNNIVDATKENLPVYLIN
jgi:uncharacterized protein YbcC (UPF0753/DUF2309 family)